MRVIAGKWRGRKLGSGGGTSMRPTTDRVKEAIFSLIGDRVTGVRVVDLCCGAGSLGVEALSRGAQQAWFVDSSRAALDVARANLERCGAAPEMYRMIRSNAVHWLEKYLQQSPATPFIVLADAPYDSEIGALILAQLVDLPPQVPLLVAVLEQSRDVSLSLPATSRFHGQQRHYGQTTLVILEA